MAAFGRGTPLPEAATEARRLMAAELHARGFRDVFESADIVEDLRLRLTDGTQLPVRPLAERCAIEPRRIWAALARHYVTAVLDMYADQRQTLTAATPASPATPMPEPGALVPAPGSDLARPANAAQVALTRELLANMPAPAATAVDLPSPLGSRPALVEPPLAPVVATSAPPAVPEAETVPAASASAVPHGVDAPPPFTEATRAAAVPPAPVPAATRGAAAPARPASTPSRAPSPTPRLPDLPAARSAAPEDDGERFSVDAVEAAPHGSPTALRRAHPGPPPPAAHLDALRRAVRARLLPSPPIGEDSWHYSRRVAAGLHVGLELLIGGTPRLLLDSEIQQMPFTMEELFHVGWRASAAEGIDDEREIAPGIRMLSGASHYVATKAADLPAIEERFGEAPHGVVIALPHRHALLWHTIWRDSVLVVEEMAQLAETLSTGGPETTPGGGLSSSLYFWCDRRLERIDLGSEPSGRFAQALATALI